MLEDRDAHAKVLAAPFDRDKAERARAKFVEMQVLIDAIDRAIAGERRRRSRLPPTMPACFRRPDTARSGNPRNRTRPPRTGAPFSA